MSENTGRVRNGAKEGVEMIERRTNGVNVGEEKACEKKKVESWRRSKDESMGNKLGDEESEWGEKLPYKDGMGDERLQLGSNG